MSIRIATAERRFEQLLDESEAKFGKAIPEDVVYWAQLVAREESLRVSFTKDGNPVFREP
jgi:hypothetical protein